MARWIERVRCFFRGKHVVYYGTSRRLWDGDIEAPCARCGKVLRGPYGLALPCIWRNHPKEADRG